jgi:phosphoglycolate phosphatase-like HAD superfamily hydrolase
MKLFLFDIDGTLMRGAGEHHRAALVGGIQEVLGVRTSVDGIPVHGMLDRDILAQMMTRVGVSAVEIGGALEAVMEAAQLIYPKACPDLSSKVLPGVCDALGEIQVLGHPMGLVTGNLSRIGWTKVERAGLRQFFSFGAFAEMGLTRTELMRMAVEQVGGAGIGVTHVGDAPSDVEAARANGFRMVAVATGLTPASELERLGADVVLRDLSRPEDRLRLIGESASLVSPA